jgi:hypothetical protein
MCDSRTIRRNADLSLVLGCLLLMGGCGASQTPHITSLVIVPGVSSVKLGKSVQLRATGLFSDGSQRDMTAESVWVSSKPDVVRIDSFGRASSLKLGQTTVTATANQVSTTATVTVGSAALVSISLAPSPSYVSLGDSAQLTAIGSFTDNTSKALLDGVSWSSINPEVATVDSTGIALPKRIGNAVISATTEGLSASTTLQVTAAPLVTLQIKSDHSSIPLDTSAQFSAVGIFKDGSSQDMTSSVIWTSLPAGLASINSSGLAIGKAIGTTTVTASAGGISATSALTISKAALQSLNISLIHSDMPLGTTQRLVATGRYTDGTEQDISTVVSWDAYPANILTLSADGVAAGKAEGAATVTATLKDVSGKASLTVSAPVLQSIAITPANPKIPLGSTHQIAAYGLFTDGSTQRLSQSLSWNSEKPEVASLSATGVATGRTVGSTTVQVRASNGMSGNATITVRPLELVNYFTNDEGRSDSIVRLTNPGLSGEDLCAMIYVFNSDQQLSECCGCFLSRNSLRTLSLKKDLVSNTLTGATLKSGSVVVVTSKFNTNQNCDASVPVPSGTGLAWSTRLQASKDDELVATETPFSTVPLGDSELNGLQSQCGFVRELGGTQGSCGCGNEK